MLDWGGINRQIKMGETSRAQDKKLVVNDNRKNPKKSWIMKFLKLNQHS